MSLTKCMKAVFDKHGIDEDDRWLLDKEVTQNIDALGMTLEEATLSPAGRKVLSMSVGQALQGAKIDRNLLLKAIRDQHPGLFTATPAPPPAKKTSRTKKAIQAKDYGTKNKGVSADKAEQARELLRKKLGQVNAGLDPEMLQAGITLAAYHIEAGAIKFADFARAMIADIGDGIRPYLKSIYEATRYAPDQAFDPEGMSSPTEVYSTNLEDITEEFEDAGDQPGNLEQPGEGATPADGMGQEGAASPRGADAGGTDGRGQATEGQRGATERGAGVPDGEAAPAGARGDLQVPPGSPRAEGVPAGGLHGRRGPASGRAGVLSKPVGGQSPEEAADELGRGADARVDSAEIVRADRASIDATLPQLTEGQREDVHFAERRLHEAGGRGVMFTNGTGTGKTFVGLGIIKRMVLDGHDNILITAPSDEVIEGWVSSAEKFFGLKIGRLNDTKDAGAGVVVTTYANFYQNDDLAGRQWDLLLHDEAHHLGQNKKGDPTQNLDMNRALTGHPSGAYRYAVAKNPELYGKLEALNKELKQAWKDRNYRLQEKLRDELAPVQRQWEATLSEARANRAAHWEAKNTRVVYLTATPFAWEKGIPYVEGFLFDFEPENQKTLGGYRHVSPRDQFFVTHLGYRIRYNKLTEPEANVDRGLLQRNFNSWLKKQGALSARTLDVPFDYSREFIAIDDLVGNAIDAGMDWLYQRATDRKDPLQEGFATLYAEVQDRWDFHERVRTLEAIKAKHAVERAKKHLAMGRKVVVFHSRIKETSGNPFRFQRLSPAPGGIFDAQTAELIRAKADARNKAIDAFNEAHGLLVGGALDALQSPLNVFKGAFGDKLAVLNGTESRGNRRKGVAAFNRDDSGVDVIIVQEDAGGAGISLHDVTGKHPRVLINLGLPFKPTQAIQIEGRIYRVGQASNAIFEYANTGTRFERLIFATRISERAGTVENLSIGEAARALKEAFIEAFENPNMDEPGNHQGVGSKEADKRAVEALTPFQTAKTYYYANQKLKGKRDQRAGIDYFPTPEPVGLKMVEWVGARPGDRMLEPSAGHGAVGRFFPENTENTFVELSQDLVSHLGLRVNGKIRNEDFMGLDAGANKYDGIVMNPPYGVGGKTAIEHLEKAAKHLRDGGRIVALLPAGPAADKRLEAFLYSEDKDSPAKGLHLVANIQLPPVTFERAGTKISSRIVVLERVNDPKAAAKLTQQSEKTIQAATIEELFDRLEGMGVPDRLGPVQGEVAAADPETDPIARASLTVSPIKSFGKDAWIVQGKGTFAHKDMLKAMGARWNGAMKGWQFPVDPTEELRAKLAAEGGETRLRRGAGAVGLARDAVAKVVERIAAAWKAAPPITVVQSYDQLPEEVRRAAEEQGAMPHEVDAVYHHGSVFVVADNMATQRDIERAVFHEVYGHVGVRAILGPKLKAALNDLYMKIGGHKGLMALAAKRGIDLGDYVEGTERFSPEIRNAILMEELLAHMAEREPTLAERVRAIIGALRAWLREHGFAELASWGDTDLANLLRDARAAVTEGARYTEGRGSTLSVNEESGEYQADLFGNPLPDRPRKTGRAAKRRDVQPVATLLAEEAPGGVYGVATALIAERTRDLPVAEVRDYQDAALAMSYLGTAAVEHFDALVTDANGKPLAIVGSYKGTLDGASVYAEVVAREAFMVKGATNLWLAHNHPSGDPMLSGADFRITDALERLFRGTGIEVAGMFAIGGRAAGNSRSYQFVPGRNPDPSTVTKGITRREDGGTTTVPIVHRTIVRDQKLPADQLSIAVTQPAIGAQLVRDIAGKRPGVLMLDNKHFPIAFVPVTPGALLNLRASGQAAALWRAVSKANAGAAVIANPDGQISQNEIKNLGSFVHQTGTRVLDIIDYDTWSTAYTSRAEVGTIDTSGTYLARTPRIKRTMAELTGLAQEQEQWKDWYDRHKTIVKDIFGDESELFERLLAITSQGASVKSNVTFALRAYEQLKRGMPFDGFMFPAIRMNLERFRDGLDIRGQKIAPFGNATLGSHDDMAIDRHVAWLLFKTDTPNKGQVEKAKEAIRKIAATLGWTPREVQAALWAANQVLLGKETEKIDSYDNTIRARQDDIRALVSALNGGDRGRVREGGAVVEGPQSAYGTRFARRRKPTGNRALDEAYELAGLSDTTPSLAARIRAFLGQGWAGIKAELQYGKDLLAEGVADRFRGILRLERQLLSNLPAEQSGYIAARLSTGLSSVMRAMLLHGAPEWRDGILQHKAGTRGLLDILDPVSEDIDEWMMWMIARRARRLMVEGRENLFTQDHIDAVMNSVTGAKLATFQQVARDFAAFKGSVLDMAQQAGLIDATTRPAWDMADWIPFYRVLEDRTKGPRNQKGLSGQTSGIRQLRGGTAHLNDPLENIIMNFAHLVDASLKNHSIRQVQRNFDNLGLLEKLSVRERLGKALVPLSEVKKQMQALSIPTQGIPNAVFQGIAQMWSFQAPTDKDVVRIMIDGKAEYFRVHDPMLLRALTALDEPPIGWTKPFRFAKRLLTGAVTADPGFILRNFARDMLHAWTINEDGFKLGIDSVRGFAKSLRETGGGESMLFAGASFQGGYVNAGDPGAVAREIRRTLRLKGYSASSINGFLSTVIDSPARLWEAYRHIGDSVENASREAVYERAMKAGKSKAQAVFEAKDLMDYSMQGRWIGIRLLADMVPFFNARVQGLYKLGRSGAVPGAGMRRKVIMRGAMIAMASLALALANRDDDRYKELEDWDRDNFWHFWDAQGNHYRWPKPFEIGLLYGTVPERLFMNLFGGDTNAETLTALKRAFLETLAFDPTPQLIKPGVEIYLNRNTFTNRPIENMGDQGKLPSARFSERTSDTMIALGSAISDSTGVSPKQLEHIWRGYTGTMGMYFLGLADMATRAVKDKQPRPALRADDIAVISSFFRGNAPPKSTRYVTEFYDMLKEVDEAARTITGYAKAGRGEEAAAVREEYADRLPARKMLEKRSDVLRSISRQIDSIYRDEDMTPAEKRARVDELIARKNQLAKEAVMTARALREQNNAQ